MKKNIIISLLLVCFSCKAQQPVIPLDDNTADVINNAYYKDLNNDLNKFVGQLNV